MLAAAHHGEVTLVEVGRRFFHFPSNYFFVDGLLIDSGGASCAHESLAHARMEGLVPHTIVNTHYHPDHTGGNSAFVEEFGSTLYAHRLAIPRLASPESPFLFSTLLHGTPRPSRAQEVPQAIATANHTFTVVDIPGHSDDHIALYEKKEKWIFTGDLVLAGEPREVFLDVKIYDAIASLETLSQMDIGILFPGHGKPLANPHDMLCEKICFLERLGERVRALDAQGLDRIRIRKELFGRERMISHLCQMKFAAQNLVDSFIERPP